MSSRGHRSLAGALLAVGLTAACSSAMDSGSPVDPSVTVARDVVATDVTVDVSAGPTSPAPTPTVAAPAASSTTTPPPTPIPTPGSPTSADSTPIDTAPADTALDPAACVTGLTVREKAALLVWPAVYADDWAGAIDTVRSNDIGGVLLMSQRGLDADQVRARLLDLEAASRHGLIVATDEEGGDVQRLTGLGELISQREVSQDLTPAQAADLVAAHGERVRAVGVDMVLGPVVDVEPNVGDVPLQPSRFFEGPPDRVTDYAAAYLEGWNRADLFATVKHYPGHGAASGDTHIAAGVTPSLDDLREFDLKPYRDLVTLADDVDAAVMIGHLTVPGLTDGVPATRSPAAVRYLRDELGYHDTVLITDALGMAAVGIPEPEASVLALAAGIDVVLFTLTSQTDAVIDALEQATDDGRIDADHLDQAARRVMTMLARDGHTCNEHR